MNESIKFVGGPDDGRAACGFNVGDKIFGCPVLVHGRWQEAIYVRTVNANEFRFTGEYRESAAEEVKP
jgi:hypothetical protein